MDHNDIRHKLSEFIDGATMAGEKAVIEQHLKTCTECSDALRELRKTIEHIHEIDEVESPAWMTQKIMAKVRAEREAKTGLWQRVFAPIFTTLPVQAVAVLFLSITAFYIYTTMHPAEKYAEAPMERFAKQEAQDGTRDAQKHEAPEITERRENKVAQRKEYKSLDMKYEYEKPAAPVPQEQPAASAPAPAKGETQMYAQDKAGLEKRSASPRAEAVAPSMMAEQAAPRAGAAAKNALNEIGATQSGKKVAHSDTCLSYEPAVSTLSGVISKVDFPGPPNYESIANGDKRDTYWILKLDRSVCVFAKDNDINIAESGVVEMQLVLNAKQYELYRHVLSKTVVVEGTLFHSHTGHHHTPVLISVQSMELLSK